MSQPVNELLPLLAKLKTIPGCAPAGIMIDDMFKFKKLHSSMEGQQVMVDTVTVMLKQLDEEKAEPRGCETVVIRIDKIVKTSNKDQEGMVEEIKAYVGNLEDTLATMKTNVETEVQRRAKEQQAEAEAQAGEGSSKQSET